MEGPLDLINENSIDVRALMKRSDDERTTTTGEAEEVVWLVAV